MDPVMSFEVGEYLGAYRIESRLGAGVYTMDYQAVTSDGDPVIARVLGGAHAREADVAAGFVDGAESMQRLRSDHLVDIIEVGQTADGQPYLIRPASDRGTLGERVRLGRPGNDDDIVRVAEALSAGLDVLHRDGQTHGDIRSTNLLLNSGASRDDAALGLLWEDDTIAICEPGMFRTGADCSVSVEDDLRAASVVVGEVALGRPIGIEESPGDLFRAVATAGHFDLAAALAVGGQTSAPDWAERIGDAAKPEEVKQPRELTLGQSVRVTVVTVAAAAVSLALGGVVLGMSDASPLRAAEQAIVGSELDGLPLESPTPTPEPIPTTLAYRELPQSDHERCLDQADDADLDVGAVTHSEVTLKAEAAESERTVAANGVEVGSLAAGDSSHVIDELQPDTLYVFSLNEGEADELIACAQTFFAPQEPTPTFSPSDVLPTVPGTKIITLD